MNPNEMSAAQLLNATIEAMVEAGPEGFDGGTHLGPRCCTMGRAARSAGVGYMQAYEDPRVLDWCHAAMRLGLASEWWGRDAISCISMDPNQSFDDLISKLRQIKAML